MAYLHACMGAPVVKPYINAIKNNWLTTFPGLTVEAVKRHLPKTIQTTMGHMLQIFGPPKKDNNLPRVIEDVPSPRVLRNN